VTGSGSTQVAITSSLESWSHWSLSIDNFKACSRSVHLKHLQQIYSSGLTTSTLSKTHAASNLQSYILTQFRTHRFLHPECTCNISSNEELRLVEEIQRRRIGKYGQGVTPDFCQGKRRQFRLVTSIIRAANVCWVHFTVCSLDHGGLVMEITSQNERPKDPTFRTE